MTKRGKFDYILLETTGLADPGMMFWYSVSQKEVDQDCKMMFLKQANATQKFNQAYYI